MITIAQLINAIPTDSAQTPQTLINYYFALRPDNPKLYQEWNRTVSSWILYQNRLEVFNVLLAGKLSYREVIEKYQLKLSINALRQHMFRLRKFKALPQ